MTAASSSKLSTALTRQPDAETLSLLPAAPSINNVTYQELPEQAEVLDDLTRKFIIDYNHRTLGLEPIDLNQQEQQIFDAYVQSKEALLEFASQARTGANGQWSELHLQLTDRLLEGLNQAEKQSALSVMDILRTIFS
jgi:hypothetical protein